MDVVWETIGGQVFETLFNHLAPKGRLIIVGSISGYKSEGIASPNIETLKVGFSFCIIYFIHLSIIILIVNYY